MRFSLSDGKESITEVLLFRQVVNSKAVRSKMLDGQFKATLVEATMVRARHDSKNLQFHSFASTKPHLANLSCT